MSDGQDEVLLGVKWAELGIRSAPYWLPLALLGGLAGVVAAHQRPLPFVSTALVAVGETWKDNPIEAPIVIAERIEGFGREAAAELGEAKVSAQPRMERRYQGRVIDVRSESSDPEVARKVLEAATARIVELHTSFAAYENRTNEEFVEFSDRRASVLESLLQADSLEDLNLGNALLAARRGQKDLSIPQGGAILPTTRISRRASPAARAGSRWKLLGASGLLSGALLGFLIFWFRSIGSSNDGRVRAVWSLVGRPMLIGAGLGGIAGAVRLFATSSHWLARAVVLTGNLGGVGPIQDTDEVIESAKQAVEDARPSLCTGDPCDLRIEILPIRPTPSDAVTTSVIEVRASSRERDLAERATREVIRHIDHDQRPHFERNYDRYRRHVERIRQDLELLENIEDQSRVDQEHLFAVMREYTTNERNMSPARSYPPEQLGLTSFEHVSDRDRRLAITVALAALGAGLGLVFAFGLAGWRRLRSATSP